MTAEQWDVLRRIAERGLKLAQAGSADLIALQSGYKPANAPLHLDLWQHMLDELHRVKPLTFAPRTQEEIGSHD